MFTRCPGCSTVHPVNAAMLAKNGGRYRCGKCKKVSSALESLFDDWPESGQKPPRPGDLPELGLSIDFTRAGQSRLNPDDANLTGEADEPLPAKRGRPWLRATWFIAALVLASVVTVRLAEFNNVPVIGSLDMKSLMIKLGLKDPPPKQAFRDVNQIHLVSRELAVHPSEPGHLLLSATIVNRAPKRQAYPIIEVTLFDAIGNRLAGHEFKPLDYLAPGSSGRLGMSPQAYLPISLAIEDPGTEATGFELDFR